MTRRHVHFVVLLVVDIVLFLLALPVAPLVCGWPQRLSDERPEVVTRKEHRDCLFSRPPRIERQRRWRLPNVYS